jgi:hypothetical protein
MPHTHISSLSDQTLRHVFTFLVEGPKHEPYTSDDALALLDVCKRWEVRLAVMNCLFVY